MMDPKIQKILDDLYAMEPELRSREQEVVRIVNELLAAKPDTKFDEKFRLALRERLLRRAGELETGAPEKARVVWYARPFSWAFIGAGAVASVLLVFSFLNGNIKLGLFGSKGSQARVTKLADNAFGSLSLQDKTASAESARSTNSKEMSLGATPAPALDSYSAPSAPLGSPQAISSVVGRGGGGVGVGVTEPSKMIAPDYQTYNIYRYVYKGEPLEVKEDTMQIFRRVKGGDTAFGQLSSLLSGARLGIDWNKFSGVKVQNISFSEDRVRGYSIYVDLNESSVSINQNWPNWVRSDNATVSSEPYQPLRLSDLPGDDKVITAADKFLKNYGIPTDSYGAPEVQKDWLVNYGVMKDTSASEFYAPDSLSVIYPFIVDGRSVYEESGYKSGLSVSVNIREMSVQNVYNLTSQQYESSGYATEKDTNRLLKLAEAGGWRQGFYATYQDPNARVVDIELGAPSVELVKIWTYKDNASQELLVPSLVFPITKKPENAYIYQKNIVVPLVKSILDQAGDGGGVPVPLMKGAATPPTTVTEPALVEPSKQ